MKKIIKIFPFIVLMILTIFLIYKHDMTQRSLYKSIENYEMIGFRIPDTTETIMNSDIEKVYDMALKKGVVLTKSIFNNERNSIDVYMTASNVVEFLSNQYDIDNLLDDVYTSIATFKTDNRDCYQLNDFLNNDRYAFYSMDELINNNMYRYGDYFLYYDDVSNYQSFLKEASAILNVDKTMLCIPNSGILDERVDILNCGMLVSVLFFILFYFILILFILYRDSKKIGVLSLLGFQRKDILNIMNKKYMGILCLVCILSSIIVMVILPNSTIHFFVDLLIMYAVILIITIFVTYAGLFCVTRFIDLSNILKKRSIVKIISNVCLFAKFIMVAILVLFTIYMLPFVNEVKNSKRVLEENEKLMNYAVFPRIYVENGEYDDYSRYLTFNKEVIKQDIDHIYVKYGDYLETDGEYIHDLEQMEKEKRGYRAAAVDVNYLNLYDLAVYDKNNHKVDLEKMNQEFYLLPKSKESYSDFIEDLNQEKYDYYQWNIPVLIYYYDDRVFDTFDSVNGVSKVESPIFRVVHESNPYTYMEKSIGIDVAGTGMNTGLKFYVKDQNNFYQKELYESIKKAGLENVLTEDNFVSYKDYYNDEIGKAQKMNRIFNAGVIMGLFIYIFLVVQTFVLFIEARKTEIFVKSTLGFSKKDIFSSIILRNLTVTLIPIIGIIIFYLFNQTTDLRFIMFVSGAYIVIDFVLLKIISNTINLNTVYTKLKGE